MSRPTDDHKDFRLELRINEETRNYIERKAFERGLKVSEWVRRLFDEEMTGRRRVYHGVPRERNWLDKVPTDIIKDLDNIAILGGGNFAMLFEEMENLLDIGDIEYKDRKLYVKAPEVDLTEFLEVCKANKVNPQNIIDKAVENIRRMKQ